MKPDSLALISLPRGALPWQILAILLVGFFIVALVLIQKAKWYKVYAQDFPTQTSTVMAGIGGFAVTLFVNTCRGALGMDAMDGSGETYATCAAFAGVGAGALGFKRFSSPEYQEGKAKIEAAKAAGKNGQPSITVENAESVNTTAERRVPGSSRSTDKPPVIPQVAVAVDQSRLPSPLDDERADA